MAPPLEGLPTFRIGYPSFLSTDQIHAAGLWSALPSPSTALTEKLCLPSESLLTFSGDEQG